MAVDRKKMLKVTIVEEGWQIKEELIQLRQKMEPLDCPTVKRITDEMIDRAKQIFPG